MSQNSQFLVRNDGNRSSAISNYKKALAVCKNDYVVYLAFGFLMKEIKNLEEAKYAFNYIIKHIDAKNQVAYYQLGKLAEFGESQEFKQNTEKKIENRK